MRYRPPMMFSRLVLVLCCGLLVWPVVAAPKKHFAQIPPDLTQGGKPDDTHDWRLGPLGANGWVFNHSSRKGGSSEARQILITRVDDDGPAHGVLKVEDVILGTGGALFTYDARKALGNAIIEAEKTENKGQLSLRVWRAGKTTDMVVTLPVMGSYSATSPFNCAKTDRIIDHAVEYMKKNSKELLKPGWIGYINGLGLLATGREDVMPLCRKLAYDGCVQEGEELSVQHHVSMKCWDWSYRTLYLCEYYLLTKDEKVLPSIRELATAIAMGQSGAGTWGHTYAAIDNTGYMHGHLGGYGAINQMGLTLMICLKLADKCGIDHPEVIAAIKRGDAFFSYFIDKGTIPYGDHGAANEWFDDNGKSGSAAIFFDLMGNRHGAEFFSDMILGSVPNGREEGHTGHYWSRLWGAMGAARGGDKAMEVFYQQLNPLYTLERQPDGRMVFQQNAGEGGKSGDLRTGWDSTGARLLGLCIPRHVLYSTGKQTPRESHLDQPRIDKILHAGVLDGDAAARAKLTEDEIFELLADPLPPVRSIGARTLAERKMNCVDRLIGLLDSDNRYARYGAAEALCKAGFGSKAAADELIRLMAKDDDVTFQVHAIDALINRDKERGLLTVAEPAIPVLLKMCVKHNPTDPRHVLQNDISRALFYNGRAQPRRGLLVEYGLDKADPKLLAPAIKEILANENGGARSQLGWVYAKLSQDQLNELWPDIYQASHYIAPSGIMFAPGIQLAGLQVMADHHIAEGLDLATWYIRYQKAHGNKSRVPAALKAILAYGPYAKRVIPQLESHAQWYEAQRGGKQPGEDDAAAAIRQAIETIKAMPDQPDFELVSIADQIKDLKAPHP